MLTDTHAHIHHDGLVEQAAEVVARARSAGVSRIVNVGCTGPDSAAAVAMAEKFDLVATIGLHPDAADHLETERLQLGTLVTHDRVVAVGECGLDYYRNPIDHQTQATAFRFQIELAMEHNLPMVWHVRDAFDDFFRIIDDYHGVQGIVHCFTSTQDDMEQAVSRGFLIALNGVMTFTKLDWQLDMAKAVPLDRLVLETDCPFLAPMPVRGKVNEPANLVHTAQFLTDLRGESLDELARATTQNAQRLFGI